MKNKEKQKNHCRFLSDNKCSLGHFGGIISEKMCASCVKRGLNHEKFQNLYVRKPIKLKTKAKNFFKEIWLWVMAGFKLTPNQIKNKRLKICKSCYFFENNKCQKCGCFTNFKTRLISSKCPIGKW